MKYPVPVLLNRLFRVGAIFITAAFATTVHAQNVAVIPSNPNFGGVGIALFPPGVLAGTATNSYQQIIAPAGQLVQVQATALPGYRFLRWEGVVPAAQATANPSLFFANGNNGIITAIFEESPGSTLSVDILSPPGLEGIGSGTILVARDPALTNFVPYDATVRYADGEVIRVMAVPTNIGVFASFVFEWGGDVSEQLLESPRPHGDTVQLVMEGSVTAGRPASREITLLFSREYHPGEGVGDLDLDGLPDAWEVRYELDPKNPSGNDGPDGNIPNDLSMPTAWPNNRFDSGSYPAVVGGLFLEPSYRFHIDGSRPGNFYIGNSPFDNWLRARGFDGWFGINPLTGYSDDPRASAALSVNPNLLSTAGDRISDGWKYWFYASALHDATLEGVAIDFANWDDVNQPASNYELPIPNSVIRSAFRPWLAFPSANDLDGDCSAFDQIVDGATNKLSDIRIEFLRGTDPIHWDTDGDGISDGYEIRKGLNPLDSSDGTANFGDDYFAYYENSLGEERRHGQVYSDLGFDGRTAWGPTYLGRGPVRQLSPQVNTRGFTSKEKFLGSIFLAVRNGERFTCDKFDTYALDPLIIDTDNDGIFDGWELYVGLNPKNPNDANEVLGDDGLTNFREFSAYDINLTRGSTWPNGRTHFDSAWLNKVWPTDPNDDDTDGDGVLDGAEGGYRDLDLPEGVDVEGGLARLKYAEGSPVWSGRSSYIGGGMNPTSMDTDGDMLPDHWEAIYRSNRYSLEDLDDRNGMDPTLVDRNLDYDGDGLVNYQEYLIGAVHHWRYRPDRPEFPIDALPPGLPLGSHDPMYYFNGTPYAWDWNSLTSPGAANFYYIPNINNRYNSTNPRLEDSDLDGMDDYWEVYHGLNPTFGVVDLWLSMQLGALYYSLPPETFNYDYRLLPFLAGSPFADIDQDGLPNWAESLQPNDGPPSYYHTDPSPLWITDVSYQRSWANLFLAWNPNNPWYFESIVLSGARPPPTYMFSFEVNEGFDTDADFIGDRAELVNDPAVSPGISDPLSVETPVRRGALYVPGNSAARTRSGFLHGYSNLVEFTVEAWVRPEEPASGVMQVILERPIEVVNANFMGSPDNIRLNFRLGLDPLGVPFVAYNGAGFDALYVEAKAPSQVALKSNEWAHIAGIYDGKAKQLRLYVNGQLRRTVASAERPFNGWTTRESRLVQLGPMVLGAADKNPRGWVTGIPTPLVGPYSGISPFYATLVRTEPDLRNHFRGWLDEVRVWDGARTSEQIEQDQQKKMSLNDIEDYRARKASEAAKGNSGTNVAEILYLYNFNDLHDPRAEIKAPAGFELLNGRPNDGSYPYVPWWGTAADRSIEYNDYTYVPWIANVAARLAQDPPADSPFNQQVITREVNIIEVVTNLVEVPPIEGLTNSEPQFTLSIVTNITSTNVPFTNIFPNTANPYNMAYYHGSQNYVERNPEIWNNTDEEQIAGGPRASLFNDLLPLGATRADISIDLWDGLGAGGPVDIGSEVDENGDGIPDWWQRLNFPGFDPNAEGPNAWDADADPDEDGVNNYNEWLAGLDPNSAYSDSTIPGGDAVPDGLRDLDGDGLNNLQEQAIGTHPLIFDTDDDGLGDGDEVRDGSSPTFAGDPLDTRAAVFNGSRRLFVENVADDINLYRLIEAWVNPDITTNTEQVVVKMRDLETVYDGERVYTLGINSGLLFFDYEIATIGTGASTNYLVTAPANYVIPTGTWTHVAGIVDPSNQMVRLYLNGKRVNFTGAVPAPRVRPNGRISLSMGGDADTSSSIVEGFIGKIDSVRVWNYLRSGLEVQLTRDQLYPEFNGEVPDDVRGPTHLFTFDSNGELAHNLAKPRDWEANWIHAARPQPSVSFSGMATRSEWPPLSLDSDDDDLFDQSEASNAWNKYRSESPLLYKALSFDGSTNSEVEVDEMFDSQNLGLFALTNWTLEAWVRPTAAPSGLAPLIRRQEAVPLAGTQPRISFELGIMPNTVSTVRPYVRFQRSDSGNAFINLTHDIALPIGTNNTSWSHIAATFSNGVLSLYVNGALQQANHVSGATPFIGTSAKVYLGSTNLIGQLQEMRIWNDPRNGLDIANYYRQMLLFSGDSIDKSFQAGNTFLGRITDKREDGLIYDFLNGVTSSPSASSHQTHRFGITGWVKMEPGAAGGVIAERIKELIDTGGNQAWLTNHSIRVNNNGQPEIAWSGIVTVRQRSGNLVAREVNRRITSEVDIRDGQWHHIAAVSDGVRIRLYLDGQQERTDVVVYPDLPILLDSGDVELNYQTHMPTDSEFRIGKSGIDAIIDEVSFWNEPPTDEEIQRIMMNGLDSADVERGIVEIEPLPAGSRDPGEPRQRLVSYVTFNGDSELPFVRDRVNATRNYRVLPVAGGRELIAGSRPPIVSDSVTFWRNELRGYFPATDGGLFVENYLQRNHFGHAGLLRGNAAFTPLDAGSITHLNTDSSGDGMPDWWKTLYGLDPSSNEGDQGAWGDLDGDGLHNYAEYLAGTNPRDFDTERDGFADYDSFGPGNVLSWGQKHTDQDGMADAWEMRYPSALSPSIYDSHYDADEDGWSNYAEFMAQTDPTRISDYPRPDVEVFLRYMGTNINAPISVNIFKDATMNGKPVAKGIIGTGVLRTLNNVVDFNFGETSKEGILLGGTIDPLSVFFRIEGASGTLATLQDNGTGVLQGSGLYGDQASGTVDYESGAFTITWTAGLSAEVNASYNTLGALSLYPATRILRVTSGNLREGDHRLFAYSDNNQNGTYDANEPAGVVAVNPLRAGWSGPIKVELSLEDSVVGYPRFAWPDTGANAYTVSIRRTTSTGQPVIFTKVISGRTYFHEGDLQSAGVFGFDPDGAQIPGYQAIVLGVFTNNFSFNWTSTLSAPVISSPRNNPLVFSQNEFIWSGHPQAMQNQIEIRRNSTNGTEIFNITAPVPPLRGDGTYAYTLPLHAGDSILTNGVYYWRLRSINPLRTSAYSAWSSFSVNLNDMNSGVYSISGMIYYYGKATGAKVIVQAFDTPGFSGSPVAQVTLNQPGPYKLGGLPAGVYYIRAFMDHNGSGSYNNWKSWGFVRDYVHGSDYVVHPVFVGGNKNNAHFVMRDVDTNNNGVPDGWEYSTFGNLQANPAVVDTDGDGISDWVEMFTYGSDPFNRSTSGDGMSDGAKVALGLDPKRLDFDGDGFVDALEVLVNSNPTNAASVPPTANLFDFIVTPSATYDVISYSPSGLIPAISTSITVFVSSADSLQHFLRKHEDSEKTITPAIWTGGPWPVVYTNRLPASGMQFYSIDWRIK